MMNLKRLFCLLILIISVSVLLFADEDILDDDLFDDIFEDAVEDIVVEEAPVPVVSEPSVSNSGSSAPEIITFTGSFSGNAGAAATWNGTAVAGGFILSFNNTLYMTAKPASDFALHAAINTTESNLSLNLTSFYFDYLWKNVMISAGKRTLAWGNIRLFNTGTYGTALTDVFSDFDTLTAEIRFPFLGNWTIAGSGSLYDDRLAFHTMKYALAYENVFLNTNVNMYGTYTEGSEVAVLELKRTLGGFDFYGQALGRFSDSFSQAVCTAGFYRLWETEGPDFGINAEYQYVHDVSATDAHKVAVETGIKQMGKHKNLKLGTQWGHNFADDTGIINVAFLIGGIFPYANWTNGISVNYGNGFSDISVKAGSTISISINY